MELECKLRSLILRWAKTLQPERAELTDNMSTLFDALRLGESPDGLPACNFSRAAADEFTTIELVIDRDQIEGPQTEGRLVESSRIETHRTGIRGIKRTEPGEVGNPISFLTCDGST